MSYVDPSPRGRHRARHAEAAPDPYVDDRVGDDDGWWHDDQPSATGDRYGRDGDWYGRDGDRYRRDGEGGDRWRFGADEEDDASTPTPAREEPAPSRAGRNLPAAIGVGLTLGVAIVASLFLWRPAFLGVVIVALSIGTWEMARAVRANGSHPPLVPLLAGGTVMNVLAWYSGASAAAVGLLLTILATLIWRLADGPAGYHRDAMAATLIAVYVPFLASFAGLLGAADDGAARVLSTLVAVVLADTGGYVAGVFFGKRPMAPSVSPKKSWEGLAGALIASAGGSAVMLALWLDVPWWWGIAFGLAVALAGVLGDLAESLLKRDLGIKDMSRLLPGHGGLMDRLDSILFAVPVAYLLLSVLAPATS